MTILNGGVSSVTALAASATAATRERASIRCMVQVLSLLRRLRSRLIGAVALYLAQPVKQPSASDTADPLSLASILLPGDVLLSDGNTRGAAIVRRITRSPWSHVSMHVGASWKRTSPPASGRCGCRS